MTGVRRPTTWVAFGGFGLVLAEVGTGVTAALVAGLSFDQARDAFVITNAVIAVSCAVAGLLLGWQRPRNPVGWLLLAAGALQAATVATAPLLSPQLHPGPPDAVSRTVATVAAYAWPWSIALCLPLALLLFPDGALPARGWRFLVPVVIAEGALFALEAGADPAGGVGGPGDVPWLTLPGYADLAPLWTVSEIVNGLVYLAAFVGLLVRYRRGDEQRRRQLLWLLLAVLAMLVMLAVWAPATGAGELVFVLLVIPLVPAAVTIAVLRHQLLDIRLVFSRAVLYALLSAAVVVVYLGLVALADVVQRDQRGSGSVVATLVIALGFNPVRVRLQRVVDRTLYGDRADPVRAVSRLGERLTGGGPAEAVDLVREALRLPYAALRTPSADAVTSGVAGERCESVPLVHGGEEVGELVVGVRSGQRMLDGADRAVLEILAVPLAMAVRATALSESVQRSRGEIVTAREEERRRLRRDLHDGLGPVLTGVAFAADAAGNLIRSDPERAAALVAGLRERTAEAIADIRRLVHELRPPALDDLGLVGALRRHAEGFAGPPRVTVEAPADLPPLPAAVEVAAYRIAMEAITNAVRHAGACRIAVCVALDVMLQLVVSDDGPRRDGWRAGVGLRSMRERAAELGGTLDAGPGTDGGRVRARLPLRPHVLGRIDP